MSRRRIHERVANAGAGDGDESSHDAIAELQQFERDVISTEDGTPDELDDDLARWQQHIFERPHEGLRGLESLFESSGFEFLTVLSLSHNVIEDITPIISTSSTLRFLNLNGNALSQLPSLSDAFWPKFRSLTLLFLSGNNLATWRSIEGLSQCPKLLWLTMDGNPFMSQVNAREFLINKLPLSLKALNDHIITDIEYIKHAGRSIRFGAQNVRLFIGDQLSVPTTFDEHEAAALNYITHTETTIHKIYARNSPTTITQRVVRGHLSRRHQLPFYGHIRRLIVRVQSTIRGYLFRRTIRVEFVRLVTDQNQQDLLIGPMDDALFMTGGAHRGLRKLIKLIQQWRVRFRQKKQAIAIKKIRFWCQMVYQRYRYRSQQLLQDQQEIFIYYTAPFEEELLEMALKAVHRDPLLMSMTPEDRETLVRQRCVQSGVSVIRTPSQSRIVMVSPPSSPPQRPPSTPQRIERENETIKTLRKTLTPPLVRIFRQDQSLETQVLATEKQLIQQDLARLKELQSQNLQDPKRIQSTTSPLRGVRVHINQLKRELEQRLVIVNKKILTTCLKLQQQRNARPKTLSLCRTPIRVRGHAPTRPERRKINRLMPTLQTKRTQRAHEAILTIYQSHRLTDYSRMRVFIPWSIDMYMQLIASLDRLLLVTNVSAGFALTYEQAYQVHAAITIQSAWRAVRCHCKRDALEVTILRAVVCLQRWWRYCKGLRRRMAFLRACLLTCGAVNSPTLFVEAAVYRMLTDAMSWSTIVRPVMRPSKEQALHCLMVNGVVEISLSPSQMLMYSASAPSTLAPLVGTGTEASKVDTQRCGAYLPLWLSPGTPEHFEESMVSRDTDATPHLLVDHVHVEPTLIERELLLLGSCRGSGVVSPSDAENPYQRFAVCRQVMSVGARVMELARKFAVEHRKAETPAVDTTSFMRLTFDSVEEARHRALVLLAKTFDPVTYSFARLYSIEALVGTCMLRHQWAVAQAIGDPRSGEEFLRDCRQWLQAQLPSKWAMRMQERMPPESPIVASPDRNDPTTIHHRGSFTRRSLVGPDHPTPPPIIAPSYVTPRVDGPAPLHIAESFAEKGIQPVAPKRPSLSSPSPITVSRHQMLTDRLGKPTYYTLEDKRDMQSKDRDVLVRDLREERERAAEALIVDKRMIQRENAAELAGIHLEMHVKLQKIKYEHELAKLHTRELVEREKMNEHSRKLTRQFEASFVAQSGAMMRNAARQAVEAKLHKREIVRQAKAIEIRERDEDEMERRHDAKSYCFVANQKTKQRVDDATEVALAGREIKEKNRELRVRQRIKEDKEIKQMLRLM